MDQISEGGRSIHEIDKIRKRLEAEKLELQSALEEAEATLEQEENKVLRCQLELNAVRQEIERRLAEKEEEFLLIKKAQSKALDSMQVALETETKSKAEALRMKKKLEGDAADLGIALEHAIAGNAETQTWECKFRLIVPHLLRCQDSKLIKSWLQLLHDVGPELGLLVTALDPHDLEDPGGEGIVIHPPACSESSSNDDRFRNHVHPDQVSHALSDLPSINVSPIEVSNIS